VATTGDKALEHAASFGFVDILITDVSMHSMNGFELRDRILELSPDTKTIFISGYDLNEYAHLINGCAVLHKPFEPAQLMEMIEEVAASPAPVADFQEESSQEEAEPVEELEPSPAEETEEAAFASEHDPLVGATLGGYLILGKLGDGTLGPVYRALQVAINRPVALKLLSPHLHADENARADFLLDVSTKANVQHPSFIAVYEAGEAEGYSFYTREYIDGESLNTLQEKQEYLDQEAVVRVVRVVASALAYMAAGRIPHKFLAAGSIFIDSDRQPHLTNLAIHEGSLPEPNVEIGELARILLPLLETGKARNPGLNTLLSNMSAPMGEGYFTWSALLADLDSVEAQLQADSPSQLSAGNAAALKALESSQRRKKIQTMLAAIGLFAVLPIVGYALHGDPDTAQKDFTAQCEIPAGPFIFNNGEKINLGTFWIDKYEVTIGQYAQFLEWIKAHPKEVAQFEHVKQPLDHSHTPPNWEAVVGHAKWGMLMKSAPITYNYPQFSVSYWDAYAYAKWKGRRLPTEQEWEKAARGTDGRLYPWGNQWDAQRCNTGSDSGGKQGIWASVDAYPSDVTPYGVIGMTGNVREWTDSWDAATGNPVVRGGSFATTEHELNIRGDGNKADSCSESLGFRTCGDQK